MKIETIAVHGGYTPEPTTKSVAVPIYQTVAYAFDNTQHGADLFDLKVAGNIYSRIMNPTCGVLEARVAAMEGGIGALAVASGMSAITYAIQTIAETGDNIVSASTLYGGTYNLFAHTFPQMGIEVRFADYRDPASFGKLIDQRTKAIYCESVGNPLGNVTDIAALAAVAHAHGVPLIVDNTVSSPYLCRPFEHGADIVVLCERAFHELGQLLVVEGLPPVRFRHRIGRSGSQWAGSHACPVGRCFDRWTMVIRAL